MSLIIFFIAISIILILLLKAVSFLVSESVCLNREELSPYECGFEHHNVSRVPFSFRYYFLTLIFLLFDLEIVLILFSPIILLASYSFVSLVLLMSFVLILFLRLLYEWNDGGLEWVS